MTIKIIFDTIVDQTILYGDSTSAENKKVVKIYELDSLNVKELSISYDDLMTVAQSGSNV